jgi:hypothetical protein
VKGLGGAVLRTWSLAATLPFELELWNLHANRNINEHVTARSTEGIFRDPPSDQQAVFHSCLLWGSVAGTIKDTVGVAKFQELDGMFARGSFDRDLMSACKLKDEVFDVAHLAFVQRYFALQVNQPEVSQVRETEFKLFKLRLQAETSNWKAFLMRLHGWHSKTSEAKYNYNATLHTLRWTTTDNHCSQNFPTCWCSDVREACTPLKQLCDIG